MMIKGSIHSENTTIINTSVLNIEVPEYTKQILTELKKRTDSNIIIDDYFNTPLQQHIHHPDRKSIGSIGPELHFR